VKYLNIQSPHVMLDSYQVKSELVNTQYIKICDSHEHSFTNDPEFPMNDHAKHFICKSQAG